MPLINKDIHRRLIFRLFLGWIGLSLLIGVVVFFYELEKVDHFVKKLAIEESLSFTKDKKDYINSMDTEKREQLKLIAREHIDKGHFIIIELYDKRRQLVLEMTNEQGERIEKVITTHKHDTLLSDATRYRRFYIEGNIFLQVFVALREANGEVTGFFEGVYEVDKETMADIREHIQASLLLVVIVALATTVLLYPVIISLNKNLIRLTKDLFEANIGMLQALGGAVAKRDSDTSIHNYRVTIYAVRLAEKAGLGREEMRNLIKGSFLHDVGKIAISDKILLKPGKLTPEEFEVMKSHVDHGVDIIEGYNWLKGAIEVVQYHHEKYDGSGYGIGLKGDGIPVNARIFAIVDVFDALTSKRPYKDPFPFDKALSIIHEGKGTHFDPAIVDMFFAVARNLHEEAGTARDKELEEILRKIVATYF